MLHFEKKRPGLATSNLLILKMFHFKFSLTRSTTLRIHAHIVQLALLETS